MFSRLVQKEFMHYMLDFRFVLVFAFCILLSILSLYGGRRNYLLQLREYAAISEYNRSALQVQLNRGNLLGLKQGGYSWNRRPEVLSSVVYGLSGTLGQEVQIRYLLPIHFEGSLFATDSVHMLFGVLDLAFVVKIILSLCVLLFTYDAICGEKEAGTLRLYTSFPVSKSKLALAKLVGSSAAVLVPFILAFLLASIILALSPEIGIQGEDWGRLTVLMLVFVVYLVVFVAFGVLVSALTHRRAVAFLGLMGLWTVWIFIIPDMALRISRNLSPVESIYEFNRKIAAMRWEIRTKKQEQIQAFWQRVSEESWSTLSETQRQKLREDAREILAKWDDAFYSYLSHLQEERHNQIRRQQHLTTVLSTISPVGVFNFVSMDFARTGPVQHERIEDAINAHLIYFAQFIQEKEYQKEGSTLMDFSPFTYHDHEKLRDYLFRNTVYILNLVLLSILGFTGAYVAILRYDVR